MFFKKYSYFQFLIKSQNQHGLHSPFVYDFITKGLYQQKIKKSDLLEYKDLENLSKKQLVILTKIVNYFEINHINFNVNSFIENTNKTYKMLFTKDLSTLINVNFKSLNSHHIIIVDQIHQHKKHKKEWQKIINLQEATVTIDLYYFGLIFFRKEQVKEHFIIRV